MISRAVTPGSRLRVPLVVADAGDVAAIHAVMDRHDVDGLIHLAAKKADESVREPVRCDDAHYG